jgi:hypothetical protein
MNAIAAIISGLALSIWDLGLNHGEFTRLGLSAASQILRSLGL